MPNFSLLFAFFFRPKGVRTRRKSNRKTFCDVPWVIRQQFDYHKGPSYKYAYVGCQEKKSKSSLGQTRSKWFHWNHQPGAHNNQIDIFELQPFWRIDMYMTIYSCHGNHIGVPNDVSLIAVLLMWLWIVNLIVCLINVFTVRDSERTYTQRTSTLVIQP